MSDSNYDWGQGLNDLALPLQNEADMEALVRGQYVAVSTTLLYGGYTESSGPVLRWLRELRTVDRTRTYLIYDFTRSPVSPRNVR